MLFLLSNTHSPYELYILLSEQRLHEGAHTHVWDTREQFIIIVT